MKTNSIIATGQWLLLNLIALMLVSQVKAQNPTYEWATGSSGSAGERVTSVAVDGNNNTYIMGEITTPGGNFSIGGTTITDLNGSVFIVKLNSSGNVLWSVSTGLGTISITEGAMAVDSDGNVYFTGTLGGVGSTTVIGNTTITNTSPFNWYHTFLAKYDANGVFQWVNHYDGNLPEPGFATAATILKLAVDKADNIIIALHFTGLSMTIGGITYTQTNPSQSDFIIAKISNAGAVVWSRHVTGNGDTTPVGVDVDDNNNIYVCGNFSNPTTFGASFVVSPSANNTSSVFLAKYDPLGLVQWAKRSNTQGFAVAADFDVDGSGLMAMTGNGSSMVIDTVDLTSFGGNPLNFATVIDINGNTTLLKTFYSPTNSSVETKNVTIDISGNLTVGGIYNFDILLEGTTFVNSVPGGNYDAFLISYDNGGNFLWYDTYSSNVKVNWSDFHTKPDGGLVIGGYYNGTSVNVGTNSFTNSGYISGNLGTNDFFIASVEGEAFIRWAGNNSNAWNLPFNWEPQQVPTATDNVKIPALRPFDPIIFGGDAAACNKLQIADGTTLRMNGGTLDIHGEVQASSSLAFNFLRGGVRLYHGSTFPSGMEFYNLTIRNVNDVDADNVYVFDNLTRVFGNFNISGTVTKPNLPKIILGESDDIFAYKDFTMTEGEIGLADNAPFPTDLKKIPLIAFLGFPSPPTVTISNKSGNTGGEVKCNLQISNSSVRFALPNSELVFFNLIMTDNFDLAGKKLNILGKIVIDNYNGSNFKITNSTPSKGSLYIGNFNAYRYDTLDLSLNVEKVQTLSCNSSGSSSITVLNGPLTADTLSIRGYLDMNGQNVTVGSVNRNTGRLFVDSLGTTKPEGTLFLYGNSSNPPYDLTAKSLNNLVVRNPFGVNLKNSSSLSNSSFSWSRMKLYGTAKLTSGFFDLGGSVIELSKSDSATTANKAKIVETPSNTFVNLVGVGAGPALVFDTLVTTPITNRNYGGLGFSITSNVPLNQLYIVRTPLIQTGTNGGISIYRTFNIYNQSSSPGMNANIAIKYDEVELGTVIENDLGIFRRSSDDPAGVWNFVPSLVYTSENKVRTIAPLSKLDYSTSPGGFTQYTLASVVDPLRQLSSETSTDFILTTYPNPFTDRFKVFVKSNASEVISITINDVSGKIISSRTIELPSGYNSLEIEDLREYPSGIYFLKVTSPQMSSILKVVKQ